MTALAMACRLILYCHGSHVADVTDAIQWACEHAGAGPRCRAALTVTVTNETRWYLSASAVRYSPFGLTARGLYDPTRMSYGDAGAVAWDILSRGRHHCRSWPAAFAWYVRGEQHGRCPHVGPESRQRWRQMLGLLRAHR